MTGVESGGAIVLTNASDVSQDACSQKSEHLPSIFGNRGVAGICNPAMADQVDSSDPGCGISVPHPIQFGCQVQPIAVLTRSTDLGWVTMRGCPSFGISFHYLSRLVITLVDV